MGSSKNVFVGNYWKKLYWEKLIMQNRFDIEMKSFHHFISLYAIYLNICAYFFASWE